MIVATVAIGVDALGALCYTLTRIFMQMNQFIRTRVIRTLVGADLSCPAPIYRPRWIFRYPDYVVNVHEYAHGEAMGII